MTKQNICNFIKFGSWLLDIISDILNCNCKNKPNRYDGNI